MLTNAFYKRLMLACAVLFATAIAITLGTTPAVAEDPDPAAETPIVRTMSVDWMDATVIQCGDHFGIVDSGEGANHPDGRDPRYPKRAGSSTGQGIQTQFISYLKSLGVTSENLDFYVGTHVHSDHIGSAVAVIKAFQPKRVYAQPYSDAWIGNPLRLWDNLWCYDNLRKVAAGTDATFIQYFDETATVDPKAEGEEPDRIDQLDGLDIPVYRANPTFDLGDNLTCTIENIRDDIASGVPYEDANNFSLGVKCVNKQDNTSMFISGDIDNMRGDESKLAKTLGHIDVLKLAHHGLTDSNTSGYLASIHPEAAIMTGTFSLLDPTTRSTLQSLNTRLYIADEAATAGQAFQIQLEGGNKVQVENTGNAPGQPHVRYNSLDVHKSWYYEDGVPVLTSGWKEEAGWWYYFDGVNLYAPQDEWIEFDGKTYYITDGGWRVSPGWQWVQGAYHYFNADGSVKTGWFTDTDGWTYYLRPDAHGTAPSETWYSIDGKWYYFDTHDHLLKGWIAYAGHDYFLDYTTGELRYGWQNIDGKTYWLGDDGVCREGCWEWVGDGWFFFDPKGAMATHWAKNGNTWYWLGDDGRMVSNCWLWIWGAWYGFTYNGPMCTGWTWDSGYNNWFYCNPAKGGAMEVNCWAWIGDAWYGFWADGEMCYGWVQGSGNWYWCDWNSGWMWTNCWVDGHWHADKNGVCTYRR